MPEPDIRGLHLVSDLIARSRQDQLATLLGAALAPPDHPRAP
ncbi:MAG TPA: hypothetical protein VFE37_09775 [Chloroflexota bacterium]|nr:hypothetical protein [Chloroflexota bacterium]